MDKNDEHNRNPNPSGFADFIRHQIKLETQQHKMEIAKTELKHQKRIQFLESPLNIEPKDTNASKLTSSSSSSTTTQQSCSDNIKQPKQLSSSTGINHDTPHSPTHSKEMEEDHFSELDIEHPNGNISFEVSKQESKITVKGKEVVNSPVFGWAFCHHGQLNREKKNYFYCLGVFACQKCQFVARPKWPKNPKKGTIPPPNKSNCPFHDVKHMMHHPCRCTLMKWDILLVQVVTALC